MKQAVTPLLESATGSALALEPRPWFSRWGAALFLLALAIAVPFRQEGLLIALGLALALLSDRSCRRAWLRVYGWPCLLAALFFLLIALHAPDRANSLAGLPYLLAALTLSVPALALAGLPARALRRALCIAIVVMLALGLDLYLLELSAVGWSGLHELMGLNSLENRNSIAALFALGIVYCVVAISLSRRDYRVLAALVVALLLLVVMGYFNNSRGGMLGALAAIPLVFLRAQPVRTLLVAGVLALVIAIGYVAGPFKAVLQHHGSLDNGRDRIWAAFMDRAAQSPQLGFGNDAFLVDPGLREQHPEIAPLYYPHSIYTDLVYSSGFVGLVFWAGWFAWLALRSARLLQAGSVAVTGLGGALLVYILVHGLVDLTFYSFGVLGLLVPGVALFSARLGAGAPAHSS